MADPQIVGWAHTKFGKSEAADTMELMAEVVGPALAHAGVGAEDVDGIFVGNFNNGFQRSRTSRARSSRWAPLASSTSPPSAMENACATGSAALYSAMDFIAAGRGRVALVVGAEKMTAIPTAEVGDVLLTACYRDEEARRRGRLRRHLRPDRRHLLPALRRPLAPSSR